MSTQKSKQHPIYTVRGRELAFQIIPRGTSPTTDLTRWYLTVIYCLAAHDAEPVGDGMPWGPPDEIGAVRDLMESQAPADIMSALAIVAATKTNDADLMLTMDILWGLDALTLTTIHQSARSMVEIAIDSGRLRA